MKYKVGRILLIIFFLNIFDAVFTLLSVPNGNAYELNPFMNWLLNQGIFEFIFVKIGVVSLLLYYVYERINSDSPVYTDKVFLVLSYIMGIVCILGFMANLIPMVIECLFI